MKLLWQISTTKDQQDHFKSGGLIDQWAQSYPQIFDADDARIARSQGPKGYHFYEWLSAVIIFNSIGYLSLMEKYTMSNHPRKGEIFNGLVDPQTYQFIMSPKEKRTQCPDLFCFKDDDWFFCEVKGKGDRLSLDQSEYFRNIEQISGKEIRILRIDRQPTVRDFR
jgi:hypothetical protein